MLTITRLFTTAICFFVAATVWGQAVYVHDFGTTAISAHPYTVAPGTFATNLSGSSWTNSTSAWTSFTGSAGQALAINNSGGTPTITLTFQVASGYQLSISSFSFWRQRSNTGATNWSMTINGISVGSGTVPTTGSSTGSVAVANAVDNQTGTVTVVISLSGASGTGTFRFDDFTLNGTVTAIPSPTRYWDVSTAAGLGGTATWGTTFSTSAAGNTALTTAGATNDIIYDGTAGTITLSADQAGNSHTFNVSSYTIATSGTGTKTLAGNIALGTNNLTFGPISGADLTISGIISGNASVATLVLNKVGAGTLILGANNTFTGRISVTGGGFLQGTAEARFGANPASFTANQITLNGGGIRNTSGSNLSFSSNRGFTLGTSGGTFDVTTGNIITLGNIATGTGGLTKTGAGTLRFDVATSHTYTGATTISAGTLQVEKDNTIADASNIVLSGGTLNTARSSDGTGRTETVGTLRLTANSTINLGTGSHTLQFANSSAVSWTAGQTLTITGWAGTYGAGTSGTGGKLFVDNSTAGLTGGQLDQIQFYNGSTYFGAAILSTGEVVPVVVPTINVGTLAAFGNQCVTAASTQKSYVVSGTGLMDNITITPPNGYELSLTSGTGFTTNPIVLTQSGGTVANTTIYVRFVPTAATSYSGTITHTSSGASTETVSVSGTGINTAATVTTVTVGTFTATTATSGGSSITGGCGTITAKGVVWGTTTNPTIASNVGITNDGTGTANYSSTIAGLTVNTTYYYRAYVTNSFGQTSYGTNLSFTFAPEIQLQQSISTNVACGASYAFGTVFTSTNNDVVVRIQNLGNAPLTVSTLPISGTGFSMVSPPALPLVISAGNNQDITIRYAPTVGGSHTGTLTVGSNDSDEGSCAFNLTGSAIAPCSELFISEYVEGSGNNKYIEIFNPTSASVNLSNYSLRLYSNGAASPSNDVALSGTIAAYGTAVYRNTSATVYTGSATVNAAVNFNGDDAVALAKGGVNVDIFGVIGNDPGSSWSVGGNSTVDQTLRRKFSVTNGVSVNPSGTGSAAFVTLSTEWDEFGTDDVSELGAHSSTCLPTCTSPNKLQFVVEPSNVQQNTAMSSVQVRAYCTSDGTTAANYTGAITLSVLQPGCGYTAQTVNAVNGIATFSSVVFLRSPQTNLRLAATASGMVGDTSNTFAITASAGTPVNTTLRDDNFTTPAIAWNYVIGTPVAVGAGGSGGTDVTGVKTFSSNDVLAKSYSANNGSGEQGSENTVTFANVAGLSSYNYVTFTFKVGSLGLGSGAGMDNDEDFTLDISTNNGASWTTVLTEKGGSNRLFGVSASPVTALSAISNTTYGNGSILSAFTLQLNGISNFAFRIKTNNNRSNENWVIDDVKLVGTTIPVAAAFNLPSADAGSAITICPGTGTQLSVNATSYQAPITYAWTPSATLTGSSLSNPLASPTNTQTYTVNITDAHNCKTSSQVQVTVHGVGGTPGLWTGNAGRDWFSCFNWSDGHIPTASVDVTVPVTSNNPMIDQPGAMSKELNIASGALVEINDAFSEFTLYGSLKNDGSLVHTDGVFKITGNGAASISGNPTTFYTLQSNKTDTIELQTSIRVAKTFIFDSGYWRTGAHTFELGTSPSQLGKLKYTNGYILGKMKRWYNGISQGDSAALFPLSTGIKDRFVTVEYTQAPTTGGSLSAEFKTTAMGAAGLPITVTDGSCAPFNVTSTADEGYWQMDNANGLTGGTYTITLVGEGFTNVTDLCELTAIKRVGGGNWIESGTHVDPSGTLNRPVVKRVDASGWSNWGFGGSSVNPLPVELVSFLGTCADADARLTWTTASEINSKQFIVEKSFDLLSFEPLKYVAAAGNSNQLVHYEAVIPRTTGIAYYRLKQEDFDGAYEYFGPVSLSCEANEDWKVYVSHDVLTVLAHHVLPNEYTLSMLDMSGKQLFTRKISGSSGSISQFVDISALQAGVYVVTIFSTEETKMYKINIMR